jgi:hypothetical protein
LAPPQYTIWLYDDSAGTLSPVLAAEPNTVIVEPVILQKRTPVPTFIPDVVPTGTAATLATDGLGILDIRSVYDVDGVDAVSVDTGGALPNIAAIADPKQATAAERPARFVRIVKAVEIPDKTVRKINASAFGPAGLGMREILGYAPVEPDGSVKLQLPANVPFTIEILDANARNIATRHASWLQLIPGETKTCNGCHTEGSKTTPSHGRSGLTTSVWAGASSPGAPFPDTVATLPAPDAGDTMAETRVWNTCQSGAKTVCSQIPSTDVIYTDVWTDPVAAGRAPDTAFSYLYANLTTPAPVTNLTTPNCVPNWTALCRITIHYANAQATTAIPLPYIQALWNLSPRTATVNGVPGVTGAATCVTCHNPVNAAAAVEVPAGQLDLTDSASSVDPTVVTSYEELLFAHNEQTLNMGVLQDLLVPAPGPPGPGGVPTTILVPVSLAPPMTAGSANGSEAKFLRMFDGTYHDPVLDHTGFLTTAELRLISEWLDIGAQYYNDPFVAPAAN